MSISEWQVVISGRVLQRFRIEEGEEIMIGRGKGARVSLDNTAVSRQHAVLQLLGGQYFVTDLESTNGTCVNGKRISGTVQVGPGDHIEIAKFRLSPRAETLRNPAAEMAADFEGTVFIAPKQQKKLDHEKSGPCLSVVQGKASPQRTPLDGRRTLTVGRDRSCDVHVPGWLVSKTQFRIWTHGPKYYLTHEAGWKRTTLNGKKVSGEQQLHRGDIIGFGGVRFRFE